MNTRAFWVDTLIKISDPVLSNMAADTLTKNMPLRQHKRAKDREYCTYLEAFGRTLCGIAPWFNAVNIGEEEYTKQQYYLTLSLASIENAVNPEAKDFCFKTKNGELIDQQLVDAAWLALAFLRSKEKLWDGLDEATQKRVIYYLKETRKILPHSCNWILFSGMIEAFFYSVGEEYNITVIDYGLKQHDAWYVGDGLYKDGEVFHLDNYNSYVIHPFMLKILETIEPVYRDALLLKDKIIERAKAYARIQERSILPDGSVVLQGRSMTYRVGMFQHLADMALREWLPEEISAPSVRVALTTHIKKVMYFEGNFDSEGWLTIGFYGEQPELGEIYISTGSLYLCTAAFLPLGLDDTAEFWKDVDEPFSMQRLLPQQ